MRALLHIVLLSSAVALLGCAPAVLDDGSKYTLEVVQTGGFAGVHETTSIDSARKVISFSNDRDGKLEDSLTDAEIASITEALNVADIPGSPGPYRCDECADQFTLEANLVVDGDAFTSQWDDAPGSPEGLVNLSRKLETMLEQKFPGQAP